MPITGKQKRWLKQQAHHLKPVVTVGQHGLTEPVLGEIETALAHHELLKVRLSVGERDERDTAIEQIRMRTSADLITRVGHVATFYRANPEKREPLPLPRI